MQTKSNSRLGQEKPLFCKSMLFVSKLELGQTQVTERRRGEFFYNETRLKVI